MMAFVSEHGGMNGYLSPCSRDRCPPIFRSPLEGMENITQNQVICAIYRLPDTHKHITRPMKGVVFPKKIVTLGDMKPDPVLWHEESRKRPWENGRNHHRGAISGRQLGEAAHRLVVSSLQMKKGRGGHGDHRRTHNGQRHGDYMHARPVSYPAAHGPPLPSIQTQRYNVHESVRPNFGHYARDVGCHFRSSGSSTLQHLYDDTFRSHPHHKSCAGPVSHSRDSRGHEHHTDGMQLNGGHYSSSYASHTQNVGKIPVPPTTNFHQESVFNTSTSYEPYGARSYNGLVEAPLKTKMLEDITIILQEISTQPFRGEVEGHLQGIVVLAWII